MARRLFSEDSQALTPCFKSVHGLASAAMYNVSATAAAWRLVQLTRLPLALVVAHEGKVKWIAKSDSFWLPITERGQALDSNTLAGSVHRGSAGSEAAVEVDPAAWLDEPRSLFGSLMESTHSIPSIHQVLSLLWIADADEETDD